MNGMAGGEMGWRGADGDGIGLLEMESGRVGAKEGMVGGDGG